VFVFLGLGRFAHNRWLVDATMQLVPTDSFEAFVVPLLLVASSKNIKQYRARNSVC
jgi:hypothetical protein